MVGMAYFQSENELLGGVEAAWYIFLDSLIHPNRTWAVE